MDTIPVGLCQCGCGGATRIAKGSNPTHGEVRGQPYRYLMGHNRRKPDQWVVEDRGYLTMCLIWTGSTIKGGYGRKRYKGRLTLTHRMMYDMHVGPIPDGLDLDHLCRVRLCGEPSHLEPVTHAVNTRRGATTKVTADVAKAIRESSDPVVSLAKTYGISPGHVSHIRMGRCWTDQGPPAESRTHHADYPPCNPSGLCQCGCGGITARAKKIDRRDGVIQGEYRRFIHNHHGRKQPKQQEQLS